MFFLKSAVFLRKTNPAGQHQTEDRAGDAPKPPFPSQSFQINEKPKINPPSTITIPESEPCEEYMQQLGVSNLPARVKAQTPDFHSLRQGARIYRDSINDPWNNVFWNGSRLVFDKGLLTIGIGSASTALLAGVEPTEMNPPPPLPAVVSTILNEFQI